MPGIINRCGLVFISEKYNKPHLEPLEHVRYISTMSTIKDQAIRLRRQGYSYSLINAQLGVSKSTMSYWFKNIPFTPNKIVSDRIENSAMRAGLARHLTRLEEIKALQIEGERELGTLSQRDLWLLGIGVYIGEGAKSTESIRISNSDPAVIRLAIRWLREICDMSDDNFSVRIHLYPDCNEQNALLYWQKVTGLSADNFRKSIIDQRTNKRSDSQGKLKYGTAHVSIVSRGDITKGVKLFRKLNGWMSGALRQV